MPVSIDWYFDFVSPFSYIALHRLGELPVQVSYKPVLFAGLLNHWGQKGPAEIPAKRRWTYRWCTWWAKELGIPFRFPAAHPFNPLPYLRLALAAGCSPQTVSHIFGELWTTGAPAEQHFHAMCAELRVTPDMLNAVKDDLRRNTEEEVALPAALEAGPVRMDVERHVVTVRGENVRLPLKEFELLEVLLRNAGRVLTRMQLIDRVWGADYVGDTKTLDVHIKRLRAKIEEDSSSPKYIVTVRGLGYKFEPVVAAMD